MIALRFSFYIFISFSLWGCAGPKPIEDYVLSQAALKAAKDAGASSYASGYWFKAELSFRKAVKLYKNSSNSEAQVYFVRSRKYAERAEVLTRLKKFKSGEASP